MGLKGGNVTEDGLTGETGLTIKSFKWTWHISCPTSHENNSVWLKVSELNILKRLL